MLLMNAPAAIAAYFLIPIALTIGASLSPTMAAVTAWLDTSRAVAPLLGGAWDAVHWGHLAVSVGVWVVRPDLAPYPDGSLREDKIAAIGVKLRRWVSFHGISINVEPDLSHFSGIVPCGITDHGVTSLVDLGLPVSMADVDAALMQTFPRFFP